MAMPEPYYRDDENGIVLYCGDCLDLLPLFEPGSVDAVVTDPPYGIGFNRGPCGQGIHTHRKRNLGRIVGDDAPFDPSPWIAFPSVVLWGADHYANKLPHGRFLAWDKLDGKQSLDSFSDVEFAWHNQRGASRIIRYVWKGLCQGAGEDKGSTRDHPTQKPVCVMRWSIEQAGTTANDLVLDPYVGSGTTLVACMRTGRRGIGIEISRDYCESAAERLRREKERTVLFDRPTKRRQLGLLPDSP